jgi:hypothetical protein
MSIAGPVFTAGISEDEAVKTHVVFPYADQFSLSEVPLRVRGIVLSSVYRAAVVSCPTNDWKTDHIAEHAKALSLFSDPYPTTMMSYTDAYYLALEPEVSIHRMEEIERTCTFWDYAGSHHRYDSTRARATSLTEGEILYGISVSVFTAIRMRGSCLAYKRSFFVTPNGFIGLAPEGTMAGDEILLLFGGKTPYVVRKRPSGGYTFLGACYLLGVLSGEALDGLPQEKIIDFTFV